MRNSVASAGTACSFTQPVLSHTVVSGMSGIVAPMSIEFSGKQERHTFSQVLNISHPAHRTSTLVHEPGQSLITLCIVNGSPLLQ